MDNIFYRKNLICTIAKEQSFSKAAQKLFIAQPSLSLMVKSLEAELGTPLFDRSSKPIRLTEAGEEYVRAAEQIQQIEHAYGEYIVALNNLDAGSLRIGSNQLLSSVVLPRYISNFMQNHPRIQISLMDANSTTLENAINAGQLDLVIGNHGLPSDLFEQKLLTTERLLLAVPAGFAENEAALPYRLTYQDILGGKHMAEDLPPVPLQLFSDIPYVLINRDNDTRRTSNALFAKAGFTPHVLMELDRLMTLYSYVELGLAASFISDTLIKNIRGANQENICFYPLPIEYTRRNIYASYKKNRYYSKAMAKFIEMLGNLE
jgi:DNA-binding transcriptional LysR family regulator